MSEPTTITSTASADQIHLGADTIDRITELAHASVAIQTHEGTHHLLVPDEYKHFDITDLVEKARKNPSRRKSNVQLTSINSFIQYAKDQGEQAHGYIYADPESRTLTAIFNDNKERALNGWRDHRAVFKAELSRELNTWLKLNKTPTDQEAFAIFLEENIADIAEPSGETLLSVATSLQSTTEVTFNSSKRLDNGQVQLTYTENVDTRMGNGTLEIPKEFTIGVRLFKNGDGYKIKARLKYRLHSGKVKFWYELDRIEDAIEQAFKDYVDAAEKESGYTVLMGKV